MIETGGQLRMTLPLTMVYAAHPSPIKADHSEWNVSAAAKGQDEQDLSDLAERSLQLSRDT